MAASVPRRMNRVCPPIELAAPHSHHHRTPRYRRTQAQCTWSRRAALSTLLPGCCWRLWEMTITAESDSSRPVPTVAAASARSLPEEAAAPILGLSESGKIRPCPSAVNPNCVSTSSATSPIASAPVIRAPVKSLEDLAAELTGIVLSVDSSAKVTASKRVGDTYYLQFSCKGMYGNDTLEFLINSSGITDRNWEGDLPGPIVTYRSVGGGVKYIYPFQTPLTDFGAQKKRLSAIRNKLKWNILGCELVECYQ